MLDIALPSSFTIPGAPRTKKNSSRIVRAKGHYMVIPSKAYVDYERACKPWVPPLGINTPINIQAVFYMPTRRRVDLVNLEEALCDILVKHGCIEDDNSSIVVSMDGSRVSYDKTNPRVEVVISGR